MTTLGGETHSLKKAELEALQKLMRRSIAKDQWISPALGEELAKLTLRTKKSLSVLIDSAGRVDWIFVGTPAELGESNSLGAHRPKSGLSGFRVLNTVLNPSELNNQADLTTLLQYRFDGLVSILATPHPEFSAQFGEHPEAADQLYVSRLTASEDMLLDVETEGPLTLHQTSLKDFDLEKELTLEHLTGIAQAAKHKIKGQSEKSERVYLISAAAPGQAGRDRAEDLLDELSLLAATAGANVIGRAIQSRPHPDPKTYLGHGRARELAFDMQKLDIDLVVADDELSPSQQKHLEKILRTRVIDRTELILDIFASRAQSWEGKIQVELAQLNYLLPRLAGKGLGFSQQSSTGRASAIATRGPGETKLELDRRKLRTRITELEREAKAVSRHREQQRKARLQSDLPIIALVGYTNAGKSTLLNTLTQAGVLAEDKLFATLDPITKRLVRPNMEPCLLVDTVGFIQKLPTPLVKAFRSTLDEVNTADLIFHVCDLSHPDRLNHIKAVDETLADLGCSETPQWMLLNKIDRVKNPEAEAKTLESILEGRPYYLIKGKEAESLTELLNALPEETDRIRIDALYESSVDENIID